MCTLSWLRQPEGFTLLFNRDERRTRSAGLPPTARLQGGVRFIAPTDPDGGGSWASVNERGLALTLLNQYGLAQPTGPRPLSRGRLLLALADAGSQAEAWDRARTGALEQYSPFTLGVFQRGHPALLLGWDGYTLTDQTHDQSGLVITSSSVAQDAADQARRKLFLEAAAASAPLDVATLERLHKSHLPEEGPLSVCMHRADAETVSLTRISVSPSEVSLSYVAGAPCRGQATDAVTLRPASSEFRVPSSAS
jgi:Transport and Golgi organisation 2